MEDDGGPAGGGGIAGVGAGPSRIAGKGGGSDHEQQPPRKKPKIEDMANDFLDFLPAVNEAPDDDAVMSTRKRCRQFWKAGDYDGTGAQICPNTMDHARLHPKYLHTNATSHKWALGAIAELLDNAIDEAPNGATVVNINVLKNPSDGSPMLLIDDNGGGMTHDRMRECMSFGYSAKDKLPNMIGQYGNGFKTSTMRLGADVLVFSKSDAKKGGRPTRSIGFLSFSFLRDTEQTDLIVPTLDYEEDENGALREVQRGTPEDWKYRMKVITKWGPYSTEESLRSQFKKIKRRGTRIIIYNLWEDDQEHLELDFQTDPEDIQIRGTRDEHREMAAKHPSAKHFFLYRHSLRIYASILYLHLPKNFKMTLRGKEIQHHNILSDVMHIEELVYKPQIDGQPGNNISAKVHLGFLKDAREHIDVQGFNVYFKNRLIKPFWRIWNSASSQGRGVIGVLEANFVAPAHDKQGFERTPVLQRLEHRLQLMQKKFWNENCQKVGYQGAAATSSGKKKKVVHEDEALWQPQTVRRAERLQEKAARKIRLGSSSSSEVSDEEDDRPVREAFARKPKVPAKRAFKDPEVETRNRVTPKPKDAPKAKEPQVKAKETQTPKEAQMIPLRTKEPQSAAKETQVAPPKPKEAPPPKETPKQKETQVAAAAKQKPTPLASLKPKDVQPKNIIVIPTTPTIPEDVLVLDADEQVDEPKLKELEMGAGDLLTRIEKIEEVGCAKLQIEVAKSRELEEHVLKLEKELFSVQEGLLQERDRYKNALEEERKQREADDKEMRRQLKSANQRIKDLEAEKKMIEETKVVERVRELEAENKVLRQKLEENAVVLRD